MDNIPSLSGKRLFWIWSEDGEEVYNVNSVFFSSDLWRFHGQSSFHFDEGTVSMETKSERSDGIRRIDPSSILPIGGFSFPSELVEALRQEGIPEEEWRETVFPEIFIQRLLDGSVEQVFLVLIASVSPSAPMNNHFDHEEQIRRNNSNLSNQASAPEYSGPLFGYAIEKRSESKRGNTILERRAPINLAWNSDLGLSAVDVSAQMEKNGWKGQYNISPEKRYVIINQRSGVVLNNLDDDAGKKAGVPLKQWHCRLYNIPNYMDQNYRVAGQGHKDPQDHNKISKYIRNTNWRFQASRNEVGGDWSSWRFSRTTDYIRNEDNFGSSNGKLDQITN